VLFQLKRTAPSLVALMAVKLRFVWPCDTASEQVRVNKASAPLTMGFMER
jgi:hypothetical protein